MTLAPMSLSGDCCPGRNRVPPWKSTPWKPSFVFIPPDCIRRFLPWMSQAIRCSLVNPWSKLTCSSLFSLSSPNLCVPPDFSSTLCPQTSTHLLLFNSLRQKPLAKFTKNVRPGLLPPRWGCPPQVRGLLSQSTFAYAQAPSEAVLLSH